MLLFPGEEHLHRAPSWGGMHDPDMGTPPWMSSYSPSSGGNTWSKRLAATNPNPNSHSNPNSSTPNDSESWEVRAFAEDASTSGQWPPRSYSCSFCQREFRTAQALGGHMNVHRRERAQANQLAQLRSTEAAPSHHHHHSSSNVTPAASLPQDHHAHHHHWMTRETQQAVDHSHYGTTSSSSSGYEGHHRHAYEESSYPGSSSYGAPPEAPFRNYSSPYEGSAWRSPYETSSRDAGLDLELRLGQRYD